MSEYIFFPNGNNVGVEFALSLGENTGWTPSMWLGNPTTEHGAREHFPDCTLYPYWATNVGDIDGGRRSAKYSRFPPQSLLSIDDYRRLKDQ
jgi:hypothetical protein